jgi:PEP-CTERM motif
MNSSVNKVFTPDLSMFKHMERLMKLSRWKMLACAAAVSLFTSAHAAGPGYEFKEGGALLTFTNDSLAALNTAGVTVSAVAPATFDGSKISLTSNNDLVTWDNAFNVTSMTGLGGFRLTSSTTQGARVDLSNVSLDPSSGTVYADVVTNSFTSPFGSYTGKTVSHMPLFAGTLIGDTNIVSSNLQVTTTLNDLKMTATAIPTLGDALGVPTFIQQVLFPSLNFGKVALSGNFVASVPEPSTWLLMALGLVGLSAVARPRNMMQ